jgi:hypothetical protein
VTEAGTTDRNPRGSGLVRVGRALGASGMAVVVAALVCFVTRAFPAGHGAAVRLLTLSGLLVGCAVAFGAALRGSRLAGLPSVGALPVAAGAIAGAYFTLHAAHAVPSLRLIESPLVAGALQAAAAAAGALAARRYRARPLAGLAALLALVAVLVPPAPAAALASAAILVVAAFTLVVPDAWRPVPQAMLVLAYAGFAAQRLYRDGWVVVPYPSRADALTAGALLALFAVAFAWPVWHSDAPVFRERERAAFLCLDLAIAWPLASLVLRQGEPRALPAALAASAALLLGLAALVHRRHPAFPLLRSAALAPGRVALAAAVASWLVPLAAPLPLFAALAGMALAMAAEYVESALLRALTLLVSLAAAALAGTSPDPAAAFLAAAVLAYTAFFVDRHREASNPGSAFFAVAAGAVVLAATLAHTAAARQPLALAALGLALVGLGHFACVRPLAAAGQIPIAAAYVLFLRRTDAVGALAATVVTLVAAGALANAWWRSLVAGRTLRAARRAATAFHALGTAAAVFLALRAWIPPGASLRWLVVPAFLALAAAAYAAYTRDLAIGSAWQALLLLAVVQFALRGVESRRLLSAGEPAPPAVFVLALLAPIGALLVLAAVADGRLLGRAAPGAWADGASALARGLATGLLVAWCAWFVAPALQFVLLEALAVAWLVHAARREDATGVALSTLLSTGAVWLFWRATPGIDALRLLDLAGFALLLVQQQLWRHRYARLVPAALHTPAMVLGIGSLWRFAHVATAALAGLAWTALAWAAVGAVACALGLLRRERTYRLLGLAILAAALARVVGLGPSLPTGTRVLSAAAIGLLALGLGFAYERLAGRSTQEAHS